MSVIKSKRGESSAEFVDNARKLEIFTIQKCSKFPKRYRFSLSEKIINIATDVYTNVATGNSIHISNFNEYELRRNSFSAARHSLQAMVGLIELSDEVFGIKANVMEEWMRMIDKELRLLQGVIRSDKKRYEEHQDE